jgi:hypothetical protein
MAETRSCSGFDTLANKRPVRIKCGYATTMETQRVLCDQVLEEQVVMPALYEA